MGQVFYNRAEELATVSTLFTVNGTPTDPAAVTLVVTNPDGGSTTYTYSGGTVTKDGTGAYHRDVSCASTTPGVWTAVWIGTNSASDVDVVTWTTFDTDIGKLYCTPEELKSRTGIKDDLDNLEILGACTAATAGIDLHCDRTFGRTAGIRTFAASCGTEIAVDLVSVTAVRTDPDGDGVFEETWSSSDWQLLDVDALHKPGGPWAYERIEAIGSRRFPLRITTGRHDRVQIEGVFGWPRVPANVRAAAAIIANDLLKLGGMAFGISGYGEYGAVRARSNPIAAEMLSPYRRSPLLVA